MQKGGTVVMWGWYSGGWNWGWMVGRMVLGVLFWTGLIWFVVRLLRNGQSGRYDSQGGDDAMAILRRRLATGEISTEEYERLKATLSRPGPER